MMRRSVLAGVGFIAIVAMMGAIWAALSPRPGAAPIVSPVEFPSALTASPMAELIPEATTAREQLATQLGTVRQLLPQRPVEHVDLLLRIAELSRELGQDLDAKACLQEATSGFKT